MKVCEESSQLEYVSFTASQTSFAVGRKRYVFPIDSFMEFTSHAITIEFSEFHLDRRFASVGLFELPISYLNFPLPLITSFMDWALSRKFFPFSFFIVSCKEESSIPFEPNKELASALNWEVSEVIDS